MTRCPCCSHQMLRQVRNTKLYWFCRSCWQEMPNLESRKQPQLFPDALSSLLEIGQLQQPLLTG